MVSGSLEALQDGLLRLGSPEDPKTLTRSGHRRVEDAVRDVLFVGVSDNDLD